MTTVFDRQPSDQTCQENGNTTFVCQPVADLNAASLTWTVNGSSSNNFPNFVVNMSGAISYLEVRGCLPQWEGTRVQCVLTLSASETIYSDSSVLSVQQGI